MPQPNVPLISFPIENYKTKTAGFLSHTQSPTKTSIDEHTSWQPWYYLTCYICKTLWTMSTFWGMSILLQNRVCLFVLIVVFRNSYWFVSSRALRFGVVPVLCNHEVWQSSDMMYPAVNNPNITSGFRFNKCSVSLASELRSFIVLRPSPALAKGQSAPSTAHYNTLAPLPRHNLIWPKSELLILISYVL